MIDLVAGRGTECGCVGERDCLGTGDTCERGSGGQNQVLMGRNYVSWNLIRRSLECILPFRASCRALMLPETAVIPGLRCGKIFLCYGPEEVNLR